MLGTKWPLKLLADFNPEQNRFSTLETALCTRLPVISQFTFLLATGLVFSRPYLLKMPAVLQIALLVYRCAVDLCILYLIVYNFTRFRCAKNHTPQGQFRCVMMCYHTSLC